MAVKQYLSIGLGYDGDKIDTSYATGTTMNFLDALRPRLNPPPQQQGQKWQVYEFKDGALRLVCDQDGLRV